MSLDELRDDLRRNLAEARTLTSVEQIHDHLVNTLWPFIEAQLEVIDEIDDAVAELVDQQEDYLQPETAAIFAAVVQSSLHLGAELKKRAGGDTSVLKLISNHEQICEQAIETLGAITMVSADEETETNESEDAGDEAQADQTQEGSDSNE
jgi:hypothetical protein